MAWQLRGLILMVFICVCTCSEENSEWRTQVDLKLTRLEGLVERLTNEVSAYFDQQANSCPQYEDIPSLQGAVPKVLPLEARRERLENGLQRVTLEYYCPPATEITVDWRRGDGCYRCQDVRLVEEDVHSTSQSRPGVRTTSVVVNGSITRLELQIYADLDWYSFLFRTGPEDPDRETCIRLPVLEVKPERDIVYEPGHDVKVKFIVPPTHREDDPQGPGQHNYHSASANMELIFLRTRQPTQRFLKSYSVLQLVNTNLMTTEFRTSQVPMKGYMEFKVEEEYSEDGLVMYVKRQESIVMRPANQSGPYPEGLLQFVDFTDRRQRTKQEQLEQQLGEIDNNTEIKLCDIRQVPYLTYNWECKIGCTAVGTDLATLDLYNVSSTGERTLIENLDLEIRNQSTVKSAWLYLRKEDGTTHIQCVASNTEGATITRDVSVYFFTVGLIDTSLSKAELINNGSEAELVCVARADPKVTVTFILDGMNIPPDSLTSTGDQTTAIKSVRLPGGPDDINGVRVAECLISQSYLYHSNVDLFEYDLEGLRTF